MLIDAPLDNLLIRIYFVIVIISCTGLAPRAFEFPFPGSLTSSYLSADAEDVDSQEHDHVFLDIVESCISLASLSPDPDSPSIQKMSEPSLI